MNLSSIPVSWIPPRRPAEDAAGRAHGDGTRGSGDDRADDDAEGSDPDAALERAAVVRLVDADPAEPTRSTTAASTILTLSLASSMRWIALSRRRAESPFSTVNAARVVWA